VQRSARPLARGMACMMQPYISSMIGRYAMCGLFANARLWFLRHFQNADLHGNKILIVSALAPLHT
jgi:hypothetical protein